ncbi:hypothetical protein F5Y07DRAFT_383614 [Xylaria sp. FL0933]|nr:hypothetical protein F5Y07DRAFT_383614 [Xylaria sp. FL0933]
MPCGTAGQVNMGPFSVPEVYAPLFTSEFSRAEKEMQDGLDIRLELLPPNDLLIALAYSRLAVAVGAQERR